ncbi:hypothetical protein HDV03_002742 [Kappamyces sp. JEL0829]|nr:hypothetical protein HDV03_002742 [Kappamyces sp. JEL0829]
MLCCVSKKSAKVATAKTTSLSQPVAVQDMALPGETKDAETASEVLEPEEKPTQTPAAVLDLPESVVTKNGSTHRVDDGTETALAQEQHGSPPARQPLSLSAIEASLLAFNNGAWFGEQPHKTLVKMGLPLHALALTSLPNMEELVPQLLSFDIIAPLGPDQKVLVGASNTLGAVRFFAAGCRPIHLAAWTGNIEACRALLASASLLASPVSSSADPAEGFSEWTAGELAQASGSSLVGALFSQDLSIE